MKKIKVMSIRMTGVEIVCYKTDDNLNPFRVYRKVANHKRQIAKYGDFFSVICFLREFYLSGIDSMTLAGTVSWAKERHCI